MRGYSAYCFEYSIGDNLHEMSKPVSWKKKLRNIFSMSSAENSTQSAKAPDTFCKFTAIFPRDTICVTSCLLSRTPASSEKGFSLKGISSQLQQTTH